MAGYEKITPEGTRDILFEECAVRNDIMSKLRGVFGDSGYREVSTPSFEFYDVFASGDKAAYYPQESMYKMTDARGRLVAVRPDNTIPIARLTASKLKGCELPVRLYYAQPVFRRRQELSGMSAEAMQMGVELIGASGFGADVDMLKLAIRSLDTASASPCRMEIGHVGIFNLLIDGIDAHDVLDRIGAPGDVLDRIGAPDDVLDRIGAPGDVLDRIGASDDVIDRIGAPGDVLDRIGASDAALDSGASSNGINLGANSNYGGSGENGNRSDRKENGAFSDCVASSNCSNRSDSGKAAEILRRLPRLFGGPEALTEARALMEGYDDKLTEMLAYLERLFAELNAGGMGRRVMIDLGLVNQAEYYSSLVFKGYTEDTGVPVLSGGRYDDLLADFGEDLPATGFGLDIDELAASALRTDGGARPIGTCDQPAGANAGAAGTVAQAYGANTGAETVGQNTGIAETATQAAGASRKLRVAITKGRLERSFVGLMEKAGYDCSPLTDKGRKLLIALPGTNIEIFLAKAPDVITYVEHGVCDIGIVGKDTIAEQGGTYYEIMDLGIGKCKFALAAPKGTDFFGGYGTKVVASKYPNVTSRYFEGKGMDVEIIKIEGSVEIAPLLSLADGIVDIVETGSTLEENGLGVIEDIRDISARFIVNVTSMKLRKEEIDAFAGKLEAGA